MIFLAQSSLSLPLPTLSRIKDYLRIDHYGCLLQWAELGKHVVQFRFGGVNAQIEHGQNELALVVLAAAAATVMM